MLSLSGGQGGLFMDRGTRWKGQRPSCPSITLWVVPLSIRFPDREEIQVQDSVWRVRETARLRNSTVKLTETPFRLW